MRLWLYVRIALALALVTQACAGRLPMDDTTTCEPADVVAGGELIGRLCCCRTGAQWGCYLDGERCQ